jgi:hypothetical protein
MKAIKESPYAVSVNLKWQSRRSNSGLKTVDDLCDFKDRK